MIEMKMHVLSAVCRGSTDPQRLLNRLLRLPLWDAAMGEGPIFRLHFMSLTRLHLCITLHWMHVYECDGLFTQTNKNFSTQVAVQCLSYTSFFLLHPLKLKILTLTHNLHRSVFADEPSNKSSKGGQKAKRTYV